MKHIHALLVLVAAATPVLAQGSDSCTTPTPIAGGGPFPFNNASATTGGQGQPVCNVSCTNDVWFTWAAPTTDIYEVSLCGGGANFDSVLGVYAGTACPTAPAVGCNDDSCGLQSRASFAATQGANYVIQLGTYGGSAGGSGTFTISVAAPCGPAHGPDVIVGDINGVSNYSGTGGLDAISLGTTSCNMGDVWVEWIAGNNHHPAIGGNLYRYDTVSGAGRFEQIGMSWLKHGFYALSDNLCCPNCIGTDGTHLGVGCSDPYTSDRNGTQSFLGPRYQVDAHTGIFVYPPANPAYSGQTARRCEFLAADVDTAAGVRYFGECQYVCPDDAAAGNNNNNASWRELTVSGSGSDFNFQLSGPTNRELSAIKAWPVADPAAVVLDVQVPSEGLYHVGYRTTNLGSGQYHYEIAVHNLNSDRDGGSFSIPIPAGVNVTNIGFHDVAYRNGDGNGNSNFSGADWTGTLAGGTLTWACEPQAANANANAIRWGSTYNFRFDANAPPVTGTATLGLWKPGAPSVVSVSMDVPGGTLPYTPFCFGDGTGQPCPCGNSGSPGHGCQNSIGSGGSLLAATGTPSLSADTLQFHASGEPASSFSIVLQGNAVIPAAHFGDGILCVGGSTRRLYTKHASAGIVTAPEAGDLSVSARSAALGDPISQGTSRVYQVFYRDPSPTFCPAPPGSTFNVSNGLIVVWGM
ncbi:MAG TPA: hypothetical protein VGR31_03970 [Planctomycetota bacterium]|nr:hypothetical protein [Planctomycetota bacterium]